MKKRVVEPRPMSTAQVGWRAALFVMALLAAGAVRAQDFKQVAPQEPKSAPAPTIAVPPEKPIVPPAVNKQLLPQLKGLRFVSSIKEIVRNGVNMPGVEVGKDLVLLNDAEIKDKLAGFLGKPLYTADLPRISQTVLDWYRAHQLPVVDVAFPAQDIAKGTVQAVVSVYKLGQIKVTGNEWFSSDVLEDEMQSEPGQPIDLATLKEDLNRLNRNPFRQVGAVLERSDTVGDTDIGLQVQDRLPLRVYASFDNEGLPVTGRDRYSTGLNWGNVLGLDQQFSYQFITSPDLWQTRDRGPGYSNDPRFTAHSASYTAPLPWGDTLNLFGTYVEQVPDLGANFGQVGQSVQLSGRYQMDLAPIGTLSQQLQFGFDYKRSNNDLSFGGTQVFANATNIEQFLLIYDGTRDDADGQTAVENQLVFSPGALSHGGTTAIYVASGVNGANAAYVYDNLQVTRVTYLPYALSSVLKLDGQLASTDLLPSEQLGAGGVDSVRGYSPRTANGTQGVLASIELRSPSYSPLGGVNGAIQDSGQLLAFFDSAFVSDLHDQAQQPKSASLESAGIGARYGIGRYFDVRFDYGWQLAKAPGAAKLGNLADVSVTLAY